MGKTLIKLVSFLAVLPLIASVFVSPAKALDNPQSFYDWNTYVPQDQKVLGLKASAQEGTPSGEQATAPTEGQAITTDYKDFRDHNYFFGFAENFTPASPFYFIKKSEEAATTLFTFNPEKRDELRLEFAGERLREMETLLSEGKTDNLNSVARDYRNTISTIAEDLKDLHSSGQDISQVSATVDLESAKHNLVLEDISLQAPPGVDEELKNALEASEKAVDVVADVQGKPAVPEGVEERLQAMKALGIMSEEEIAKVIQSPSREQAREELRKFVEVKAFPEADFKRFDETARNSFPQGYYTALEYRKFKELKDLETQKPDEGTITRVQEFADTYKPGDAIPPDLRRWWVPMVRLEELQNTIRPDLIPQDYLRNRPSDLQKYQEVVERIKPTQNDAKYVDNLIRQNPDLLNDPSYARVKALADKFGSHEASSTQTSSGSQGQSCGRSSHWVAVGYMPGGGYCVPNYDFPAFGGNNTDQPCPSGYHRNYPGGACYADSGEATGRGGITVAPGSCPSGYSWTLGSASGGYCAPRTVTDGGQFPSPIYTVGYCLPGQMFRDGKCETYNQPPSSGCPSGQWWNGSSCIATKTCGTGEYQDSSGNCVKSSDGAGRICASPPGGCGFNAYWDTSTCSCRSTTFTGGATGPGTGTGQGSCSPPPGGCGSGYFDSGSCSCKPASSQGCYNVSASSCGSGFTWDAGACTCRSTSNQPSYSGGGASPATSSNCGSGYAWNGSYCAPTSGGTSGGSSSSYPTPSGSGSYPTPSYSYPSPSSGTPDTSTYPTPSYNSPPAYETPSYNSPPAYNTPESAPAPAPSP